MKKIALIGSTGSIGTQVLEIVDSHPDQFKIVSLAAGSNAALLKEQIKKYRPIIATISVLNNETFFDDINETKVEIGKGSEIKAVIDSADVVFISVNGFVGVDIAREAIRKKKDICLATKEVLVCAGELIMKEAVESGVKIIPVDSEHSAIFQCLDFNSNRKFDKLYLTASGGAFRDISRDECFSMKAKDALKHPNWNMGSKITIDCATMVNKAFEVAEAMWLFNSRLENIEVVMHRQSIVHSMVGFEDGVVIAQMSLPTMLKAIQIALTYPDRLPCEGGKLDFSNLDLTFRGIDEKRYPCFGLIIDCIKKGGVYLCACSSADEEIVRLFLDNRIVYKDIYDFLKYVIDNTEELDVTYDNLKITDKRSRLLVEEIYRKKYE